MRQCTAFGPKVNAVQWSCFRAKASSPGTNHGLNTSDSGKERDCSAPELQTFWRDVRANTNNHRCRFRRTEKTVARSWQDCDMDIPKWTKIYAPDQGRWAKLQIATLAVSFKSAKFYPDINIDSHLCHSTALHAFKICSLHLARTHLFSPCLFVNVASRRYCSSRVMLHRYSWWVLLCNDKKSSYLIAQITGWHDAYFLFVAFDFSVYWCGVRRSLTGVLWSQAMSTSCLIRSYALLTFGICVDVADDLGCSM